MAERIPQEILSEIRARVSIADVISEYVALRKAGRSHTGLCPFHHENTPSFSVNDEGGFFHCFGCGVGGNVFTFLTRIEGISFPEAVRRLANKAGVTLPHSAADPQARERAQLYRLNEVAATYFRHCLWGNVGKSARDYLAERGIQSAVAERFRLGFAPSWGGGLVRFLSEHQADLPKAASLGLVGRREDGRYYDRFRHRLMFPITDVVGRIVGFGGRLLPTAPEATTPGTPGRTLPKYLNSPDSVLYKKGTLLYGLDHAKEAIQRQERVFVVEGYIDLLALVQSGYHETVAVLGTALGVEQLRLVRRFAQDVYLFFDGDEAGRRAATRAFPLCVETDLRGRGVFLPQGYDPDTFARQYGQARLATLIEQAEPLEDFYFSRHAPPAGASAFQRAQAAKEALAVLEAMTDVVARGALFTQIAQRFGVSEEELRRIATLQHGPRAQQPLRTDPVESPNTALTAETELIQLMLIDRSLAVRVAAEGILAAFQHWQALGAEIVAAWQHSERIDVGGFLDRLPKAIADRITRAYVQNESEQDRDERERMFTDCIAGIRSAQRRLGREQLLQAIRTAEQQGDEVELRRSLQRLREWDQEE
jgi:DNA primase